MANELDELEALTQAAQAPPVQAPQIPGAAPAPGGELDDLAGAMRDETDAVTKARDDERFDETEFYRQNGKSDEALDFAAKVKAARQVKPAEPLKAAGSMVKGVWDEVGNTGSDVWEGGKASFTGKHFEPKSGLGSFAGGVGKVIAGAIMPNEDPAGTSSGKYMSGDEWMHATKERMDKYDALLAAEGEKRTDFIRKGGKPQDFVSKIKPKDVVTPEERTAYDNQAKKNLEASAAIHVGAMHGANLAIKGWRAATEWDRDTWTPDQWKDRIRDDAALRDTEENLKAGNLPDVERDNLHGMARLSAMITPDVPADERARLTREGTYSPEAVEQMSGVADPTNLLLAEGLRLPIVAKAGGAALRLSGSGMKAVGGVVDRIAGHGAGRVIATTGGTLAAYEVGKHALHGDYKPFGVALALFGARYALRRGGGLVDDAGRELLNPEGFNSTAATKAAQGLAEDAAAGTGPKTAVGGALSNFVDADANAAAASRIARRTIQGATIGVEGAVPFAALSDNPEQAGHALGGGVAFGGALGPIGGIEPSLNRAMEINKAATAILAERGGAQTFSDPALQKAHDAAMADIPTGYRTYLNAMRGLVSGFRGRSGEPMKIALLQPADFGAEIAKRTGSNPQTAAENAHGFYDANSGTVFINKASLRSRTDAAGHETGHFITDEVMEQMGRAYGDALRNTVEKGLFNGDKPTPEFQRFIDEYNKHTPGTPIPSDKGRGEILKHRGVSEYLAETTRNILGEPNLGRFMLPKDVSDMMADKLVAMYGDEAGDGPKQDIFKRTDLPTIHAALKDVVFDLGRGLTPPAQPARPGGRAGAGTPQAVPVATGSPGAATAAGTRPTSPNPAMPQGDAEPHADIGVTQDTLDAVRDYHIAPPGMEPRTQRTNRRRGVEGKSADRIAEERGNEWDEMFSNYAEFLRTNDLQAPADPTELHQAVVQHALASDPVARSHADAVRPTRNTPAEPVPTGALATEGASSIESKTPEGVQPRGALEPAPAAPVRENAPAHTEQEINNRLADAEKEAEADPSFARKREKGQAAAKREARVNALLDVASESSGGDQGLLQRRTDAGGQERFTGRLDPENLPAHRMLLDELGVNEDGKATIDLLNDHVGQTVYLDYKSAPKSAEGDITGQQRRKEYQESPADERKAGGAHVEQKGKAFHITGFKVWPGKGSITLTGFSPDKWIANAHKLMDHVRAEGQDPGYTGVNDPHLATDMQGYAENHANGYKGDGSAPVEGREPTEGYTPWEIPKDRFNLLNAALNFDVSTRENSGRPGARENAIDAQIRAGENNVDIDPDSGDVNPLRAYINKSGKLVSTNAQGKTREGTGAHLENVHENISPDLVTGLSTTPDGQNIVRPVGFTGDPADVTRSGTPRYDYGASGFMPKEGSSIQSKKGALEGETQEQYAARLRDHPESLIEEHRNEAGVPVLNGDAIIYNAPEFKNASKEDAPMVAKKLYPEAKAARDAALDHLVEQPIEGNGDALVMAGGIGSGKSTISKRLQKPEFIYDTNLKSFDDATRNIDQILKSGRTVHLALVEREPGDAMRANLERFQKEGRIEYADDVGSSNAQARENVRKLAEHYADNPYVTVEAWKNVRGQDPVKIPLSEVEDISVDAARKRAHDVLNEIEKGTDQEWKGEPLSKEAASIARGTSNNQGRGLATSNLRAGGVLSGEGQAFGTSLGGSPRGALSGPIEDALRPNGSQGGARGDGVSFMPSGSSIKSKSDELGFHSGLSRLVDSPKLPNKGSGEQMLNTLKSQGAKPEELEWTGTAEFLKTHPGPVTKEELKAFVDAGGVKLKEVQHSTMEAPKEVSVSPSDFTWVENKDGSIHGKHPDDDSTFTIRRAHDEDYQFDSERDADEQPWMLEGDWGDAFDADSPWHAKRIAAEYVERNINERAQEDYDQNGEDGATKYKDYTLPGGENYKEVLLTLPREGNKNKALADWKRQAATKYGPDWTPEQLTPYERTKLKELEAKSSSPVADYSSSHWDEDNVVAHIRQQDYTRDTYTAEDAKAIGKRMAEGLGYKETSFGSGAPGLAADRGIITPEEAAQYSHYKGYTSGHDQGGASEKIRLIEELQSDWHQEGRKDGYDMGPTEAKVAAEARRKEIVAELEEISKRAFPPEPFEQWVSKIYGKDATPEERANPSALIRASYEDYLKRGGGAPSSSDIAGILERHAGPRPPMHFKEGVETQIGIPHEELEDAAKRARDLTTELRGDVADALKLGAVPDAPFKKTWVELAFKRALRMAAEDGQDRIAWTPGKQQAERYDLSKQVGILSFDPKTNRLLAKSHGNATLIDKEVAPEKLADYVGKDVAKKLLETEPERGLHTLEGPSLKAGGEGMIGFYDKILPDFVRKYVKKWGGAVDKITIDTPRESMGSTQDMLEEYGVSREQWKEMANEAKDQMLEKYRKEQNQTEVWSVKITPEMRDAVMGEGQPMFMPKEDASSIKSKGALSGEGVAPDALGFVSGLRKAASERLQERSTPEQVLGVLDPAKGGVKKEELEVTGLPQFLEGKKTVTKREVLDFLDANAAKLDEVVKGTGKASKEAGWTPDQFERAIQAAERRQDWDEAERLTAINEDLQLGSDANSTGNQTKFSQYKTPGGENYRERLLKLPEPRYAPGELTYNREESASRSNGLFWIIDAPGQQYQIPRSKAKTPADAMKYVREEKGPSKVQFEGNHWNEKDVVAHTREQDFNDTDGKSVRLIEEVQSDWHQKGRKEGYQSDAPQAPDTTGWTVKVQKGQYGNTGHIHDQSGSMVSSRMDVGDATPEEILSDWRRDYSKAQEPNRVPDGPFKKTWHELGFKRALAEAVKDGKDKIAWVTGEQAADRFDLSKQVSRIEWQGLTSKPGQVLLSVFDTNGDSIMNEWQPANKLPDLVGKEVAAKIAAEPSGALAGDGLKVGGAGMKGFYDKILPDFVKKYVKPWGGKVETSQIVTREPDHPAREFKSFDAWHRAKYGEDFGALTPDSDERIAEYHRELKEWHAKPDTVTVHSVTITPAMRKAIQGGQPMFMPSGKGGALASPVDAPAAPRRLVGALAGDQDDD